MATVAVVVQRMSGEQMAVTLDPSLTILDLKKQVFERWGLPWLCQQLLLGVEQQKDDELLANLVTAQSSLVLSVVMHYDLDLLLRRFLLEEFQADVLQPQGFSLLHTTPRLYQMLNMASGARSRTLAKKNQVQLPLTAMATEQLQRLKVVTQHENLLELLEVLIPNHPTDLTPSKATMWLVNPAVEGDLASLLQECMTKSIALPVVVAGFWLRQMLSGLHHLHRHDILHRSLSASKVLFSDGLRRVQLGGVHLTEIAIFDTADDLRAVMDIAEYYAPELMWGQGHTPAADIWALGVILFEMRTLTKPFQSPNQSMATLLVSIMETEAAWDRWPDDIFLALVRRLLAKDMTDRPSVAELLQEDMLTDCCPHDPARAQEAFVKGVTTIRHLGLSCSSACRS